jgi:hypothetical protein
VYCDSLNMIKLVLIMINYRRLGNETLPNNSEEYY